MKTVPCLKLGNWMPLDGRVGPHPLLLPAHHLVTHGVVVGMTGSGKTGLLMVLVEETLRARVPVLMIDVKGDLPNLLLSFPSFEPKELAPWMEETGDTHPDAAAAVIAADRAVAASDGRHGGRIDYVHGATR